MLFGKPFRPQHEENRMRSEGDVAAAREHYLKSTTNNLRFLLTGRFSWMNVFIPPHASGIEIGAGTGVSKEFITADSYRTTDYAEHPWLDVTNVDALKTPFRDGEFDFIVASNTIHHVPYPMRFFKEMHRILKPGGVLLIQEISASFFMRVLLRLMRHEGYSFKPNVFDPGVICTDPRDLWSANCAIPDLLFRDKKTFETRVPFFAVEKHSYSEFFTFINSGGVIAKTFFVPLPLWMLKFLRVIDNVLVSVLPGVFALQQQIVLRKKP